MTRVLLSALILAAPVFAQELATLSGKTVSIEGQPLKKTRVRLVVYGGAGPKEYSAISDPEGKFAFKRIQPAQYLLIAERQGYLQQGYGAKRPLGFGKPLTLGPGEDRTDLTIALTPYATISGKVLDDDGDPVANAAVSVEPLDAGKRSFGQGRSDESGDYKAGGLAPGRYRVLASTRQDGYLSSKPPEPVEPGKIEEELVPTYYPSVTDPSSASAIEVVAGRNASGMDIRLRKSRVVRIKGNVEGSVPGEDRLAVSLLPKVSRPGRGYITSAGSPPDGHWVLPGKDGSFELFHVQAGSYFVAATTLHGSVKTLARQAVEVGSQNVEGVILTPQPLSELRGTVTTDGKPDALAPATMIVLNSSINDINDFAQAKVSKNGTFVLNEVSRAKYRVSVYENAPGTYLKSIRYGDSEIEPGQDLDLSDGVAGSLRLTFGTAVGEIGGSVQANGQAVAGGAVTLVPDPPDRAQAGGYRQVEADRDGQFHFKDIAPGNYRVYAWEELEAGAQYDPEFMKPFESQGVRVTLAEKGKEQLALTRISAASVDEARQKSGR